MTRLLRLGLLATAALACLQGCGGSGSSAPITTRTVSSPPTATTSATTTDGAPGSLQAEANAAATGDIPDNQVFLTLRSPAGGFSIKYPEGWAQTGHGKTVVLRDKNNIVRVVVGDGAAPTTTQVQRDVGNLKAVAVQQPATRVVISGRPAIRLTYKTESAPNPVTGKRVTLIVDRYYVWNGSRSAVVDLGTPQGVDNVDAYRMMIESFRWK